MNNQITYTNLRPEHAAQLRQLQLTCFPNVPPENLFSENDFLHMSTYLADLVFVALADGIAVGMGSGIYCNFNFDNPIHTLDEIVGGGNCRNHNPNGSYYYGTDISVHPNYRRRGIGGALYALRKDLVRRANKRGIVAGGEIPGYAKYRSNLSANAYVKKVAAGELYDATLTFQLSHGFQVHGVLPNYFYDKTTDGWASFIVWENPDYREERDEQQVGQHSDRQHSA
jgi:GNAT superfamily N-acetyltransferase